MNVTLNPQTLAGIATQDVGTLPPIIDVKSGEATARAGLLVTTSRTGATSSVTGDLTVSQQQDLEALLALLGLDGENAKNATLQTVLKAIQSAIKQQAVSVTTVTTGMVVLSDYDVTRLEALKKACETSDAKSAQDLAGNVNRMFELKGEIEALAKQGMVYDGKFEGVSPNPNFELNTRVRELGDRMIDISVHYKRLDATTREACLDTLAPAMKTAVQDLVAAYGEQMKYGWSNVQAYLTYQTSALTTLKSFESVIASPDLQLPPQISRDALSQILKEIIESVSPDATADEIAEKLDEKMQEIAEQLANIDIPMQA